MSWHYNSIGTIQIVVPIDDYNIKILQPNAVVYDVEHGTTYVLVNIKHDTSSLQITANGYTADWLLNKRAISTKATISNIESGVYGAITSNLRGLPRISNATSKGLSAAMSDNLVLFGGQLLSEVAQVLNYADLGRRMVWSDTSRSWKFEIYKGEDRTSGIHAINFVDEMGTCKDLVANVDFSALKNICYVPYALSDETTGVAVVGNASGADRYELWSDETVTQDTDESKAACIARAKSVGAVKLRDYTKRQSFDVVIDAADLGTRYNLGDVVSCVSFKLGVSFKARISGVSYTIDKSAETFKLILGEPKLTLIGGLKLGIN